MLLIMVGVLEVVHLWVEVGATLIIVLDRFGGFFGVNGIGFFTDLI
jgi:hypothetical protein